MQSISSLLPSFLQGKRNLVMQTSGMPGHAKSSDVKTQLANALLKGEGTARERLQMRRKQAAPSRDGGRRRRVQWIDEVNDLCVLLFTSGSVEMGQDLLAGCVGAGRTVSV